MKTRSNTLNNHLKESPKKYLYHYTTPSGLIGILKSNSIWATHIRYLNDHDELIGAFEIAKAQLDEKLKATGQASDKFKILSKMEEKINLTNGKFYVYVCSFSNKDDSLPQWRAYCPPTGGYALGVSTQYLKKKLEQENMWFLGKCIYNKDLKGKIINEVIDSILQMFTDKSLGKKPHEIDQITEELAVDFNFEIAKIGGLFKDDAFIDEDEWRLIAPTILVNNDNIQFREGASCIIPYYEFGIFKNSEKIELHEDSIKIIIGPTPYIDTQAKQAAQHLLTKEQKISGEIVCSEVPFNGLM